MAQWLEYRIECWEAWGSKMPHITGGANRDSIPLESRAIAENLHFLLFIVCRPIGSDNFEEFHIDLIT